MPTRPALVTALLFCGVTSLAGAVHAADAAEHGNRTHSQGRTHQEIDLKEAARHATEDFNRIDSNNDERISQAELAAGGPMAFGHGRPGGRHGRMHAGRMPGPGVDRSTQDVPAGMPPPPFEDALPPAGADDANPHAAGAGGRPSREELQQALFARLDADNDGRLTAGEFANLGKARRDEMRERGFKRMDRDGDGLLTRTEFPPMQARLRALDTNQDGKVSGDEFPARGPHHDPARGPHHDPARHAPSNDGTPQDAKPHS